MNSFFFFKFICLKYDRSNIHVGCWRTPSEAWPPTASPTALLAQSAASVDPTAAATRKLYNDQQWWPTTTSHPWETAWKAHRPLVPQGTPSARQSGVHPWRPRIHHVPLCVHHRSVVRIRWQLEYGHQQVAVSWFIFWGGRGGGGIMSLKWFIWIYKTYAIAISILIYIYRQSI